jgi:hypothetical protein
VTDLRLVQDCVAFDDHKCGNRGPKAEAYKPASNAMGPSAHGLLRLNSCSPETEHTRAGLYTRNAAILHEFASLLHCCNNDGRDISIATTVCKGDCHAAWPQSITLATQRSSCSSNQMR